MTIATKKIKLFGQTAVLFQVVKGKEVVQVLESKEEAEAWIAAQG